jgi:hypothetical protein
MAITRLTNVCMLQYLWTETSTYSFLNDNGFLTWYKAMTGLSKYASAVPKLAASHPDLTEPTVRNFHDFSSVPCARVDGVCSRCARLFDGSKASKPQLC